MSDKELDQLFKSQFEDFEIEPSKESWNKIEQKIALPIKRRSPFLWMAAASILIVLGFGLQLFIQPAEKIRLHKKKVQEVVAHVKSNDFEDLVAPDAVEANESLTKSNPVKAFRNENVSASNSNPKKNIIADATTAKDYNVLEETIEIADVEINSIKPLRRKPTLSEEILADEERVFKAQNLISKQALLSNDKIEETPGRRTKIRSVGDLVNFVVAKVDNREEKLIYFSKTEESDLEITGINLGLFKYIKD